jgi:uncharacterized protein
VSNESPVASAPAAGPQTFGATACIIRRDDGVFVDPMALGATFQAAVNDVFFANSYFSKLDYAVFLKILYDCGPNLPRSKTGEALIRLAADVLPFVPLRRELYKAVKLNHGEAEYYFEQAYLRDPDNPDGSGTPTVLNFDEFVADMWMKGVRFGIDAHAVRAAISSGKTERVLVARRLDAVPGIDATIIEVSDHLHRSDAPRQLANGKLDLMAFQNRFPQIEKGERLLKKVPRSAGTLGFELAGTPIEPPIPNDVELGPMAGAGTVIDITGEGEFLVSQKAGFLNVDAGSGQLSVEDKIISREGVSSRTTGNLQLTGDYEEYGEVQEKRLLEGENITIHADVFGNIISRGGTILLNHNLVGGTAHNAKGDIVVKGIASGAVLQTSEGMITLDRAESCTISASRVKIEHATNCEIIADEVTITLAEGCAVAARKISIEAAGPRKQSEMLVYVLLPDTGKIDEVIAQMSARAEEFCAAVEKRKLEMDTLTNMPDVKKYIMLASKVRKKELVLTPEQLPQFQKMALAVGPALKAITKVSLDLKAAETEQQAGVAMVAQLTQQKKDSGGGGHVEVKMVSGDTLVRTMKFSADGKSVYDMPSKDIKTYLRGSSVGGEVIFSGSGGKVEWDFDTQS